jgi:hypothetical protein
MHVSANDKKRSTTLSIPVKTLAAAERIARLRKVNLSVIVSEVLEEGLRAKEEAALEGQRRVQAWEAHRQSFARLTKEQQEMVNGIFMDEDVEE